MASPIINHPSVPQVPSVGAGAAAAPDASTAGAIAQSSGSAGGTTTTIKSLADLKKKAPAVYKQMMMGIAMDICNDMQASQERLKELQKEYGS
ncbi:MAG: hypothetical protein WCG42_07390 [Parachlamydiaceae bacterium]